MNLVMFPVAILLNIMIALSKNQGLKDSKITSIVLLSVLLQEQGTSPSHHGS